MEIDDKRRLSIMKKHPLLYPENFFFECENGWLDLIEELSDNLEAQIEEYQARFPADERPICTQAKARNGVLLYSMALATVAMWEEIDQAVKLSKKTCEICGKWGSLRLGKPMKTRCEEHQYL